MTDDVTIGTLYVDGAVECFTLEDKYRGDDPLSKIPGGTAIPCGQYKVIVNQSVRFKRLMPLLLDVPGFEGLRIHPGNDRHDTEGCILVGQDIHGEMITKSVLAYNPLFQKLKDGKDIMIDIRLADLM